MNVSGTSNSSVHSEDEWKHSVKLFLVTSIHSVNYLLGLPLNACVMAQLLNAGRRSLDPCDVVALNQAAVEIFFLLLAPFHVMCDVTMELCFYKALGFVLGVGMLVRSLLQCWVCVERYVAVAHPVTFLKLRRLGYHAAVCIVTWTCGLAVGVVCMLTFPFLPYRVFLIYASIILSVGVFSCVSILNTLRRPGPGQSNAAAKKRAFHLVLINLLTFLVQNTPISVVFGMQDRLSLMDFRLALAVSLVINILMGFISPVFLLHKAGKFPFLKSGCF